MDYSRINNLFYIEKTEVDKVVLMANGQGLHRGGWGGGLLNNIAHFCFLVPIRDLKQ